MSEELLKDYQEIKKVNELLSTQVFKRTDKPPPVATIVESGELFFKTYENLDAENVHYLFRNGWRINETHEFGGEVGYEYTRDRTPKNWCNLSFLSTIIQVLAVVVVLGAVISYHVAFNRYGYTWLTPKMISKLT